jgi:hypothetical protein
VVNDVGIRRIVVGVMTSCGIEIPGFISRQERGIISSLKLVDQLRCPTTFVKGRGCRDYFQGVKPQKRDVDQ